MKFGEKIKELRGIKGITQFEVAVKTGISRSVLSQYENNLVEPTAYVVKKLAEFFDVSADYLLGLEDDFGARIPASSSPTAALMGERLTKDERELLDDFRKLSPYLQGIARNTVRGLTGAGAQGSDLPKKA